MDENSTNLLDSIVNNTDSVLIAFFAVLIVALIPLYVFILNSRKHSAKAENERAERYMEREKRIIEVVTNNTEVMSKMAVTLERDGKDTVSSLVRVHERLDMQNNLLTECVGNQVSMKNDIREIMLKNHAKRYTADEQEENGN